MNKSSFFISIFLFVIVASQNIISQKGIEDGSKYGKGEDSVRCVKCLSLYREFVKQNNFIDAIGPWRIVFNECPEASKNIYIDGAKIYNDLIQKEENSENRNRLLDTLMLIYDQRIKYFAEKGSVLGRKGVDLLRYNSDDLKSLEEGYNYLYESIQLCKNESSVAVIAACMMATFSLYQAQKIEAGQVIQNFIQSDALLDASLVKENDPKTIEVKETILNNFIASGAGTCESLIAYYEPMFEQKKCDLTYLTSVTNILSGLKCEDRELFGKAAELRFPLDPSVEAAKKIAEYFVKKEVYTKASEYYKKAIELETDSSKLADYYNQLAIVHLKLNQFSTSRSYAYKAIHNREGFGEPYLYIGLAYAFGHSGCGNDFEERAVFWAAVDKFYQAKSVDPSICEEANKYISMYSNQFPDKEMIFMYGFKEGDPYNVGCWINESTKVRSR